jgi:hypothetical protein
VALVSGDKIRIKLIGRRGALRGSEAVGSADSGKSEQRRRGSRHKEKIAQSAGKLA